ncbi:MAG: hypothetical protein E7335_04520 [Clostridiales bacterium]|nr:hypothetical protein [Clostridiales bacterium]
MKNSRLIRLSLIFVFEICILLCYGYSVRYTNQFEAITLDILSNSSPWQRLVTDAILEQSVSEEHAAKLLSESNSFVQTIEYLPEYSGIYLVTKQCFPSKEGILISTLDIEPIPLDRNIGKEIELLDSVNGLYLYRLHYYWD